MINIEIGAIQDMEDVITAIELALRAAFRHGGGFAVCSGETIFLHRDGSPVEDDIAVTIESRSQWYERTQGSQPDDDESNDDDVSIECRHPSVN